MTNTVSLTLAFDKAAYTPGDTMVLTVSGTATKGASAASSVAVNAVVALSDGTIANLASPLVGVNAVAGSALGFAITSVVGSGRTWAIAANGLSATATA